MPTRTGVQAAIHGYMRERAGTDIEIEQVVDAFSGTYARTQVLQALSKMAKQNGSGITRVRFRVYRYDATRPARRAREAAPEPELGEIFEYVGSAADGSFLVRSETGKVYKLRDV